MIKSEREQHQYREIGTEEWIDCFHAIPINDGKIFISPDEGSVRIAPDDEFEIRIITETIIETELTAGEYRIILDTFVEGVDNGGGAFRLPEVFIDLKRSKPIGVDGVWKQLQSISKG